MAGVFKQVDSSDFFVQAQDFLASGTAALVLNVGTTAGAASPVSADISNRLHRGMALYVTITSMTVNSATLAFNLNGKDASSGNYFTIGRVSLDGLTNGSNGRFGVSFYPGMTSADLATNLGGSFAQRSAVLPAVFQVQASLTITTTASMSGTLAYSAGMSRVL